MPIKYRNRKNQNHYIREVLTNKGAKRYYIVKKLENFLDEELLNEIPEGFEFYEFPDDARVSFRKIIKSNFNESEKSILEEIMENHKSVEEYIIDLEKDTLLIYIGHLKKEDISWVGKDNFHLIQSFNPKLRFEKDTIEGIYKVQRFCNLSRYYGWITLETHKELRYLGEKYCYHIDKESLLKFWIEGEEDW